MKRNIDWGSINGLNESFTETLDEKIHQLKMDLNLEGADFDVSLLTYEKVVKKFNLSVHSEKVELTPTFIGYLAYTVKLRIQMFGGDLEIDRNDGYEGWEPYIVSGGEEIRFILRFADFLYKGERLKVWVVEIRPNPLPHNINFARINSLGFTFPEHADRLATNLLRMIGPGFNTNDSSEFADVIKIDYFLDHLIFDKPDATFEDIEPIVLGIIAFYGNEIIKNYDFKWGVEFKLSYGGWLPYLEKGNTKIKLSQLISSFFYECMNPIVTGSMNCFVSGEYMRIVKDL